MIHVKCFVHDLYYVVGWWLCQLKKQKNKYNGEKKKTKKNIFLKYFIVDFNVLEIILPKQKYILHIYNNVWFYLQNGDLSVK